MGSRILPLMQIFFVTKGSINIDDFVNRMINICKRYAHNCPLEYIEMNRLVLMALTCNRYLIFL